MFYTRASAIARALIARNRAADIIPVTRQLQQDGVTTLWGDRRNIERARHPAPGGGNWSPVQVSRVLALAWTNDSARVPLTKFPHRKSYNRLANYIVAFCPVGHVAGD
jgi:hypothetical protein